MLKDLNFPKGVDKDFVDGVDRGVSANVKKDIFCSLRPRVQGTKRDIVVPKGTKLSVSAIDWEGYYGGAIDLETLTDRGNRLKIFCSFPTEYYFVYPTPYPIARDFLRIKHIRIALKGALAMRLPAPQVF